MPYLIFIVNKPCCPKKISWQNVKMPNQTIGVISTPNAGGIAPRINLSNGSVGQDTRLKGNSLMFWFGYQEITTRHNYFPKDLKRKRKYHMKVCECGFLGYNVIKFRLFSNHAPLQKQES